MCSAKVGVALPLFNPPTAPIYIYLYVYGYIGRSSLAKNCQLTLGVGQVKYTPRELK